MEDLKEYVERHLDEVLRRAGFTQQTPQKETKEPTTISGTITFLGTGTLARMKVKLYFCICMFFLFLFGEYKRIV
jgi:hypothetical protein